MVGGAIEAGSQLYHSGHITSWRAVGGSAVQGAVVGGAAGFTGGAGLLATSGANVVGGAANRAIQGKHTTLKNVATDAVVGAAVGVGGKLLSKGIGAISSKASKATTTLFRGVNEAHPGYENAVNGIAEPIGANASAAAHNAGNTASQFTSWTTNPDVATNFALRPGGSGVMMEVTVPTSSTVTSPSAANVNLIQSPGTVVNESEVLLKGTVSGAKVTPVKPQ